MDFALTEEQRALQDSVRRFVSRDYTFEARSSRQQADGFDAQVWQLFADQGWLGAGLPEHAGGYGGTAIESSLVLVELGRGLVLEPYSAVAVLTAQTLIAATPVAEHARRLEPLVNGQHLLAFAHREAGQDACRHRLDTHAIERDGGYRLSGRKQLVLAGPQANSFLISARTHGERDDADGLSLFQLPADSVGLTRQNYRLIDGTPVCDIAIENCQIPASALVGETGGARAAVEHAQDHAVVAVCAQAVGAMERAIEITTDYLRTRKQFGVAIGTFQALQHRLADMLIELEQSRAMLYRALSFLNAPAAEQRLAVAATKAQIGKSARYVGAQAIQLHGGIGVTEEYSIGHYFKFLTVAEGLFGNTTAHLGELARNLGKSNTR